MRKLWPGFLTIAASAAYTATLFNRLPERVVSHWGANGQANGWASRDAFVFGMYGIALGLAGLLAVAPKLDPKRYNFESHESSYWLVANATLALLALATTLAVGINAGLAVHIEWLGYALGALLVVMGNVFTRVRPNWVFGVRTPWTLSSDKAWREAHRVAGYGFVVVGIATILATAIRPDALTKVLLPGVIVVTLASIACSYIVWKNDSSISHSK